jgi:hypothetical protein
LSSRYNETERLGVLAADTIFTREFRWIFREQPIVDVGIDALVEKSDDGNPAGKFIALQIKSGAGNFTISKEKLCLYLTNVHRNYWLNLNIPILLIAYLPKIDICYWEIVSSSTLIRTDKQWKIDIPKSNTLNSGAKPTIENYLFEFVDQDSFSQTYRLEFDPKLPIPSTLLQGSQQSVLIIHRIFEELGKYFKESKRQNDTLKIRGVARDSPELKSNLAQQARIITSQARRIWLETQLFSENFAGEYLLLEKYLYSWISRKGSVPEVLRKPVLEMPGSIEKALTGAVYFRDTVIVLKSRHNEFEGALDSLSQGLVVLCAEYQAASEMISKLCVSVDDKST